MELAERESLEHVSAGASGPIDLQIAAQDRRAARTACYEYDPSSVYSDTYGIHLRRTSSAPGIYRKCNPESARLLSLPLPLGVRLFIGVLAITSIALIAAAIVYVLFAGRQQTLLWHSAHAGPLIAPITAAASPVEKTQTLAVAVDLAPSPQSVYALTRLMLLTHLPVAGTAATLLELEEISHADPQVAEVCHALAHDLGHAALTSAHVEISQVLGDRDDVCGGGFTHGVVEQKLGDSKNLARDLLRICAPKQDGSCFHGVGHGLMFATGLKFDECLDLCDQASSTVLSHRCG